MIAFELSINGEPAGTFGFEDWTILSAILVASKANARRPDSVDEFRLDIGGLETNREPGAHYHLRLFKTLLGMGDEVLLRIVETDLVNAPIKRHRSDRTVQESPFTEEEELEFEREEYERLKAKFEPGA
ncbi:MAG: hypothetical protein Q8S09_16270 [Hyphomonas sp.]|nr:hypothetical protein [Hyphomonas sp.]